MFNVNKQNKNRQSKNKSRLLALKIKAKNTLSPIIIKYAGLIILCVLIINWMLEKIHGSDSELMKWNDPKNFYSNVSLYEKYISMKPLLQETIEAYNKALRRKETTKKWYIKENITEDEPKPIVELPACSLDMKTLGPVKIYKEPLTVEWVMNGFENFRLGGAHSPSLCRPKYKVAIVVPYRDQSENLARFLYHIHPFLVKQLIEYRIFIVEQTGQKLFNKGALMNVGFITSQQFGNFDCYIFHDVDLLPLDSRNLYSCREHPTMMATVIETGSKIKTHRFGGVIMFTKDRFKIINGYSNCYWGGGVEDDLFIRLRSRRYIFHRTDKKTGRYVELPHKKAMNHKGRFRLLATARKRSKIDGLKSVNYTLIYIGHKRLFTHIVVDISGFENSLMLYKCNGQGDY